MMFELSSRAQRRLDVAETDSDAPTKARSLKISKFFKTITRWRLCAILAHGRQWRD
jgi:hypothetical protein